MGEIYVSKDEDAVSLAGAASLHPQAGGAGGKSELSN